VLQYIRLIAGTPENQAFYGGDLKVLRNVCVFERRVDVSLVRSANFSESTDWNLNSAPNVCEHFIENCDWLHLPGNISPIFHLAGNKNVDKVSPYNRLFVITFVGIVFYVSFIRFVFEFRRWRQRR
jgi:hypothetical protein